MSPVKHALYFYISTFRSTCEVPSMAIFCISLILCFPGMLLGYCLSDFEMVPIAPIIGGITLACTFHMRRISTVRCLYFKTISASFLITFLFQGTATSVNPLTPNDHYSGLPHR